MVSDGGAAEILSLAPGGAVGAGDHGGSGTLHDLANSAASVPGGAALERCENEADRMRKSEFRYELPDELIAQEPLQRGASRMMVVDPERGSIEHASIRDLPDLLDPVDLLVANDTRVIPARLFADPKPGMTRRIEILLARNLRPNRWRALTKPAKRLGEGDLLRVSDHLHVRIEEKLDRGEAVVELFDPGDPDRDTGPEIERVGRAPLPPYIRREATELDRERYQTLWAKEAGAVAAPTAGLHFSESLLQEIRERGVGFARVTLHVGLGTFRPVEVEDVRQHVMDVERYRISERTAATINETARGAGRVVAVGTTTVRALESSAEPTGSVEPGERETGIFITPGFEFRATDALLTNFHLPESTLLMLVSAFAGRELVLEAYRKAVEARYRFFSYGDAMFFKTRIRP